MFWHYVFSNNSAQIEKLLQKEDVTLQELMEEEELLQECQAQNKKLVDFLCQENVLQELVTLVVTEPSSDAEYQVRFKHASLAAELLSAEVPAIVDKLAASEELLAVLCKFLCNEKPLNPLLASFFSKVLSMLMHRRSEQNWYQYQVTCFRVLDFLKSCPDFIPRMAHHIGTSAVMNLLQKLMCGVEEDEVRSRIHAWMRDTPLISLLISKLGPENEWCEQGSVEQLLCDVLDSGGGAAVGGALCGGGGLNGAGGGPNGVPSLANTSDNGNHTSNANQLLPLIMNENIVQQLIALLLHEQGTPSSVTHVTNVLMKMLAIHSCLLCLAVRPPQDREVAAATFVAAAAAHLSSEVGQEGAATDSLPPPGPPAEFCVARAVADVLPQIHSMLLTPHKESIQTSYGACVERVGTTRLRLIALITALIESRHFKIHQILAQLQTIPHILELFFRFPQNNFLHSLVQRCVLSLLAQQSPCRTPPDAVLRRVADAAAASRLMQTADVNATPLTVAPPVEAGSTPTLAPTTTIPGAGDGSGNDSSEEDKPPPLPSQPPPIAGDTEEKMETSPINSGSQVGEASAVDRISPAATAEQQGTADAPSSSSSSINAFSSSSESAEDKSSSATHIPSSNSSSDTPPPLLPDAHKSKSSSLVESNSTSIFSSDNTDQSTTSTATNVSEPASVISSSDDNTWNPATVSSSSPPAMVPLDTDVVPDEESHPLLCQLIREGQLVQRILLAYHCHLPSMLDDGLPQPPSGSLCGYRGHVRLLANSLMEHVKGGPNAPLLNMLLQSLPSEVYKAWLEFQSTTLAQANALNEISPVPGPETSHTTEDSDEDDMHSGGHLFSAAHSASHQNDNMLQITEDGLHLSFDDNNGFDAVSSALAAAAADGGSTVAGDEGASGSDEEGQSGGGAIGPAPVDLFEKMCSAKLSNSGDQTQDLDNMWSDKERHITFAATAAAPSNRFGVYGPSEEESASHSSEEEEEDEEDVLRRSSALDNSMEVDDLQDDWESVFDRRNSDPSRDSGDTRCDIIGPADAVALNNVPVPMTSPRSIHSPSGVSTPPADFNPWQSAPSSDTVGDDTSWARFGGPSLGLSASSDSAAAPFFGGGINFGPSSFGGSGNPFEALPKEGQPVAAPAAAVDPFAFEATFPDTLTPATSSGGVAQNVVARPEGGTPPCSSNMDTSQQTPAPCSESSPSSASPPATPDKEDLATNFHFLSQLGALKSGSTTTPGEAASSSSEPDVAPLPTKIDQTSPPPAPSAVAFAKPDPMDIVSPSSADPSVSDASYQPPANDGSAAKMKAKESGAAAEDMEVDGTAVQEEKPTTKKDAEQSAKSETLASNVASVYTDESADLKEKGSSTSA